MNTARFFRTFQGGRNEIYSGFLQRALGGFGISRLYLDLFLHEEIFSSSWPLESLIAHIHM